jgi:hypothetical protein
MPARAPTKINLFVLEELLREGLDQKHIAKALGVHSSSITRAKKKIKTGLPCLTGTPSPEQRVQLMSIHGKAIDAISELLLLFDKVKGYIDKMENGEPVEMADGKVMILPAPMETRLKGVAEARQLIQAMSVVLERIMALKNLLEWQDRVMMLLEELDPDARDKFTRTLKLDPTLERFRKPNN